MKIQFRLSYTNEGSYVRIIEFEARQIETGRPQKIIRKSCKPVKP